MNARTVDASVVAAAFFREEHADAARSLLVSDLELYAPDLVLAEMANVIWKRHTRGEIDAAESSQLLADVLTLPLQLTPSAEIVAAALELATRTRRTVYDCLYLALAIKTQTTLITGDRRLANALAATPLAKHILWIGDYH